MEGNLVNPQNSCVHYFTENYEQPKDISLMTGEFYVNWGWTLVADDE